VVLTLFSCPFPSLSVMALGWCLILQLISHWHGVATNFLVPGRSARMLVFFLGLEPLMCL
jgi:hypothetical protein